MAGYSDGTMRVFNISRTEMELKMHPHATVLTAVAYSTDGEAVRRCFGERSFAVPGLPALQLLCFLETCPKTWVWGELEDLYQ